MIEQQIIAQNYDPQNDPEKELKIESLLKLDEERFLRRRLLETAIKDTISAITDDETDQALTAKNRILYVKNIFSNDSVYIQKVYRQIQSGQEPEDVLNDLKNDRGKKWDYAENWIKWGDLDLDTENKLYAQKPYTMSAPVKSLLGWHLFKIDSVQVIYQFNSSQIGKEISDTRNQLKYRKLERAAAPYIKNLVQSKNLVMSMKTAGKIWEFLNPFFSDPQSRNPVLSVDKYISEIPQEFLKTPVAWVDGIVFTVEEFIARIPDLSRNLIKPNLRNAIEIAIRDKILAEEAVSKGLKNDPVVIEKTNRSRMNYRYMAMISTTTHPGNQITLSPEAYYQQNKNAYIKSIQSKISEIQVSDPDNAISIAKKMYAGFDIQNYKKKIYWISSADSDLGEKAGKLKINDVFAPLKTDSVYCVIQVLDRRVNYFPFEEIKDRVKNDLERDFLKTAHKSILPADYAADQIIYYDENISRALTRESKTIF